MAGHRTWSGHGAARADAGRRAVRVVDRAGVAHRRARAVVVRADSAARAVIHAAGGSRSRRCGDPLGTGPYLDSGCSDLPARPVRSAPPALPDPSAPSALPASPDPPVPPGLPTPP